MKMSEPIISQVTRILQVSTERTDYMSIHPDFRSKEILSYIADLISNYGYSHYNDLMDSEKEGLASLLVKVDEPYAFINDYPYSDELLNVFCQAMTSSTKDKDNELLAVMKSQAINHYDLLMQRLFNHVLDDYQAERNQWLDHASKYGDPDEAYDRYLSQLI
jgi:hypothetical protein